MPKPKKPSRRSKSDWRRNPNCDWTRRWQGDYKARKMKAPRSCERRDKDVVKPKLARKLLKLGWRRRDRRRKSAKSNEREKRPKRQRARVPLALEAPLPLPLPIKARGFRSTLSRCVNVAAIHERISNPLCNLRRSQRLHSLSPTRLCMQTVLSTPCSTSIERRSRYLAILESRSS